MESAQKADTVFSGVIIERLLCLYHWPLVVSTLHRESPQLSGASSFLVIYFHMESLVSLGFIQYPIFFSNNDFATHCRLGLKSRGCVSKWEEIDSEM